MITALIIVSCFLLLSVLINFWLGKDWNETRKERDREKRMNDVLNESLEQERNMAQVLESEVGKLTRGV